jgi:hypothetical protein
LHVWDQTGNDLLPTFLIPSNEISVPGWWEKDISDFDIIIYSGKIKVGMCQCYLPYAYPPPCPFPPNHYFLLE